MDLEMHIAATERTCLRAALESGRPCPCSRTSQDDLPFVPPLRKETCESV